jgi:hypothetical protein
MFRCFKTFPMYLFSLIFLLYGAILFFSGFHFSTASRHNVDLTLSYQSYDVTSFNIMSTFYIWSAIELISQLNSWLLANQNYEFFWINNNSNYPMILRQKAVSATTPEAHSSTKN